MTAQPEQTETSPKSKIPKPVEYFFGALLWILLIWGGQKAWHHFVTRDDVSIVRERHQGTHANFGASSAALDSLRKASRVSFDQEIAQLDIEGCPDIKSVLKADFDRQIAAPTYIEDVRVRLATADDMFACASSAAHEKDREEIGYATLGFVLDIYDRDLPSEMKTEILSKFDTQANRYLETSTDEAHKREVREGLRLLPLLLLDS